MNIIFVANHYIEGGKPTQGFTAYLYRVTQALLKMGHNPVIIAGGKKNRSFINDGIEVHEVAIKDGVKNSGKYGMVINNLKLSFFLNKRVKEVCGIRKIDIIQFTSLSQTALFYYGRTPAVLRLSSYTKIAYDGSQTLDKNIIRLLSWLELLAARRCSAVFAPSRITADAFCGDLNRKVAVIESPFFDDIQEMDYKVYNDNLQGKKYVLFFGRLYAEKGILVIADILYEFLQKNKEYYMVFCGKDELIQGKSAKRILKDAAADNRDRLLFFNPLPHDKLYPIIKESEYVILPSFMENFSNACVEAMYFKKLVIGTDGASFEQLISDGKNGFLCQINDSNSLLEKMQMAVNMNVADRERIGLNAHRRIQPLKPEIAVQRLVEFYKYIVSQGGSGCR